ncbi:MAG: hypothetical protein FWH02_00480 [Oscillospiraceae bacterium]|nr:hypothetical protein [Oscillospiraceae bacterium]
MQYAQNTSSAYDLSAFEERRRAEKPSVKMVKTSRRRQFLATLVTPKSFFMYAAIVMTVCFIVYNNAKLSELNIEISQYQKELRELHSNYVKMESQAGSSMSPRTIAHTAENTLGLERIDKHRAHYIYLFREDRIELADESKMPADGITQRIAAAVSAAKEYLSAR